MAGEHLLVELDRFDGDAEFLQAWREGMAPEPTLLVSEWADRRAAVPDAADRGGHLWHRRRPARARRWRAQVPPVLRALAQIAAP